MRGGEREAKRVTVWRPGGSLGMGWRSHTDTSRPHRACWPKCPATCWLWPWALAVTAGPEF